MTSSGRPLPSTYARWSEYRRLTRHLRARGRIFQGVPDVTTKVNAMPRALYFPKLEKTDTSMFMLGWGGASTDAIFTLQPVLSSYNGKGDGDFNYGRYTNAKVNDLTAKVKVEMTEARIARGKFSTE